MPTPFPWNLIEQYFIIRILFYARIAGMILLFAGDHVFAYLQSPYPPWYLYMKNNKFAVGALLLFGFNIISSWVSSSGAFEVIYDGTVLYSGLKTRTIPNIDEIVKLLKAIAN